MEKLLLSKDEILKAIKNNNFKNEEKNFAKLIKRLDVSSIVIEEKKAKLQNGFINGVMMTEGSKDNSENPEFVTVLDQNFHTDKFPLLIQGDEMAAWSYVILSKICEKEEGEYPYKKEKMGDIAMKLAKPYFEKYYLRLNLILKKANVTEMEFKEDGISFEHKVWVISSNVPNVPNNKILGYVEPISLDDKSKQHIVFVD